MSLNNPYFLIRRLAVMLSVLYIGLSWNIWENWLGVKDSDKRYRGLELQGDVDEEKEGKNYTKELVFANFSDVFLGVHKEVEVVHGIPPSESRWLLPSISHPSVGWMIPPVIHKVYFQNDGHFQSHDSMHDNLKSAHQSWRIKNPKHEIRYYNLRQARYYLRQYFDPVFLRAFDCIQAYAGKADFFRVAVVYRDGGFYSDWKQVCLKDGLLDDISKVTQFWVAKDRPNPCTNFQNAFFGAIPRHPILAIYLKKLLINVQSKYYGRKPWAATGPCVFGEAMTAFGYNESLVGAFRGNQRFKLTQSTDEVIVMHKCKDCGGNQDWNKGNNYFDLWKEKKYYCEDASILFD